MIPVEQDIVKARPDDPGRDADDHEVEDLIEVLPVIRPLEDDVVDPRPEDTARDGEDQYVEHLVCGEVVFWCAQTGERHRDADGTRDEDPVPADVNAEYGECDRVRNRHVCSFAAVTLAVSVLFCTFVIIRLPCALFKESPLAPHRNCP